MKLLTMVLVRMIYVALAAICVKLNIGVNEAELTNAANLIAAALAIVLGVLAEKYVPTLWAKFKEKFWVSAPLLLLPFILVGCSNLTPQQRYDVNEAMYIGANIGLSAAHAAGKIPPKHVPGIQTDLATAKADLDKAQAWLDANPNLANVIGLYVPELDAAATAVKIARRHLIKFALLGPLPSSPAPTTQP